MSDTNGVKCGTLQCGECDDEQKYAVFDKHLGNIITFVNQCN